MEGIQKNSLKDEERILVLEAERSYFAVHLKPVLGGFPEVFV